MTRAAGTIIAALALAALPLVLACGGAAADHAAHVASQQHGCPRDRVRVIGDGGHWQYWLDVCGRRRLYTTQGGRYEDITASVAASPPPPPPAPPPSPGEAALAAARVAHPECPEPTFARWEDHASARIDVCGAESLFVRAASGAFVEAH